VRSEDLLSGMAQYVRARTPDRAVRLGYVDAAYDYTTYPTALPAVVLDGETTATKPLRVVGSYWPVAGDRVVVQPLGRSYVILGPLDAPRGRTMRAPIEFSLSGEHDIAGTVASTVPGCSVTVTTTRPGAHYVLHFSAQFEVRVATATTAVVQAVVGATVRNDRQIIFNQANIAVGQRPPTGHQTVSGTLGAAGAYTFALQRFRVGGADNAIRLNAPHTHGDLLIME
jgi:hypothetical protein